MCEKFTQDISSTPLVIFTGVKDCQIWPLFLIAVTLNKPDFEMEKNIANLKCALGVEVITVNTDSETLPVPHLLFIRGQKLQNLAFEAP